MGWACGGREKAVRNLRMTARGVHMRKESAFAASDAFSRIYRRRPVRADQSREVSLCRFRPLANALLDGSLDVRDYQGFAQSPARLRDNSKARLADHPTRTGYPTTTCPTLLGAPLDTGKRMTPPLGW